MSPEREHIVKYIREIAEENYELYKKSRQFLRNEQVHRHKDYQTAYRVFSELARALAQNWDAFTDKPPEA